MIKKFFFILVFSAVILGFSQNAQASVSDGNWWEGCSSVTSKTMSFLSDKLGVKLAYAQVCNWTTAPVCSLASAYHRWYIDEASGTTVADDVLQDPVNGTAVGTTIIIPGKFGNARNFNGTSDYVSVGDIFTAGTTGTISLWIKPSGNYSGLQVPFMGYTLPSAIGLGTAFGTTWCSGQWMLYVPNTVTDDYGVVCSGLAYNAANFPTDVWTHLAIVYVGTSAVTFYKNGAPVGLPPVVARASAGNSNNATFSIGRQGNSGGGYFSGGIDEVGLWRLALTPAQILSLHQNNRSGLVVAKTTFSWPSYSFPNAAACSLGLSKYYRLTVTGNGGGTFSGLTNTSYIVNLYPSTAYTWNVEAYDFSSFTGVCGYYTIPAAPAPPPFTTPVCPAACYEGKVDIGLRAQELGATVKYAAESGGISPLRVFRDGVNYGIILVDPSNPNASKARVQTSSGVKAFCKFP